MVGDLIVKNKDSTPNTTCSVSSLGSVLSLFWKARKDGSEFRKHFNPFQKFDVIVFSRAFQKKLFSLGNHPRPIFGKHCPFSARAEMNESGYVAPPSGPG